MKRMFLLLLLVSILLSNAEAQRRFKSDKKGMDVVYLVDGSIYRGEILSYEIGERMLLRISNDVKITIAGRLIEKVVQEAPREKVKPVFSLQTNKFYNSTNFYFLEGFLAGNRQTGMGIQNTFGYKWKSWLAFGLGVGYDNYNLDDRLSTIPIFIDIRGQITDHQVSPFYNIQAGYSIGLKDEDLLVAENEGGWLVHTSMGVIFNSNSGKNAYTLDLGYRFQRIAFRREFPWNNDFDDYRILYKRLSIRAGIIF